MIKGIYSESEKKDPVYLILFVNSDDKNSVDAWMVDENGRGFRDGKLFSMDVCTGKIKRNKGISPAFGFDLTKDGKLKIK